MTHRPTHVEPSVDPVTVYARDLATLMMSARDLLSDDGYAAILPALASLSAVLPPHLIPAPPERHLRSVPYQGLPWEE